MADYNKRDLREFSGEDLTTLEKGDTIKGVRIEGFMPFSSFTGVPYDVIGSEETKLVFGGMPYGQRKRGYENFSVGVIKVSHSGLILGTAEN